MSELCDHDAVLLILPTEMTIETAESVTAELKTQLSSKNKTRLDASQVSASPNSLMH